MYNHHYFSISVSIITITCTIITEDWNFMQSYIGALQKLLHFTIFGKLSHPLFVMLPVVMVEGMLPKFIIIV